MADLFGQKSKDFIEKKLCATCGHYKQNHTRKYGCMITYKRGMENCDCMGFKKITPNQGLTKQEKI